MSIVAWIVLGLIAGFIASKLVNKTGSGLVLDIVLGVINVAQLADEQLLDRSYAHGRSYRNGIGDAAVVDGKATVAGDGDIAWQ
jgi:hypothetical protein